MNKNNKRYVTIEGKTFKSRKEACEYYNINYATVSTRLDRGWSLEEAITTPNKKHNNFESSLNNEIDLNGEKITIYEACKKYNIPKQLVYSRYYYCGWSFEEIFGIKDRNGKYNLVKIKNKTLIVFGDKDKETPLYMARALNKGIADSRLITIKDAGHFCFIDKPNKFNLEVREFLLS